MEQPRSLVIVGVFALVLGTFVQPRATAQKPAAPDKASTPKAGAHTAAPESGSAATTAVLNDPIDALDVLAESFGVDIARDAIRRRLVREVGLARQLPVPDDRVGDARTFLTTFAHGLPASLQVDASVRRFGRSGDATAGTNITQAEADALNQAIATYFAQPSIDLTGLQVTVLREVARRQATPVSFLIATLPDPIDSFTGWQFDPMLEAISQAVSASDYVFERFQFPDADAGHSSAERAHTHESESSVVLYHRHRDAEPGANARELLVLLIVHENPSAGVHIPALLDALRLVTSWKDPAPGQRALVRILGPTFSGSSNSIGRTLNIAYRRQMLNAGDEVRLISGSATDQTNKAEIENALQAQTASRKPKVTFHATVQPDTAVLPALLNYVRSAGWPRPIAVLFEGNTQYGRSLADVLERSCPKHESSDLILLPFPLNVSRDRNTTQDEKLGLAQALGLPSRFRPLSMDAVPAPLDQIPQLSPETTTSYVELALSTMLQTLRAEHVGTVALMATDPRDKLFLARQIAHDTPNVSLLTVESDSIYYHPDYASYLQGALVASTYPLYTGSQRWSFGFGGPEERHVFANGSAEGTYNAAILLLNYDVDGQAPTSDTGPNVSRERIPRLIDYGMPGSDCSAGCEPPVWLSVIGASGAWPVQPSAPARSDGYILRLPPQPGAPSTSAGLKTFPSRTFTTVLIALTAILALIWIDVRHGGGRWTTRLAGRARGLGAAETSRRKSYAFVAMASLVTIELFLVVVESTRLRVEASTWFGAAAAGGFARLMALVAVVPLSVLNLQVFRQAARGDRAAWTRSFDLRRLDGWIGASAAAMGLWAVANLAAYTWSRAMLPRAAAASFVVRATTFSSGVSPALPIIFLFAGFALWGVVELARMRSPGTALADDLAQELMALSSGGRLRALRDSWTRCTTSTLLVPPALAWVVVLGVAATSLALFDPFVRPLVTIEGPSFGRFVSSAILMLQVMIGLALLQFVCLWVVLKPLLERLSFHGGPHAYDRVPRALFPAGLFPGVPGLDELGVLVEHYVACLEKRGLPAADAIQRTLAQERSEAIAPHWSASATWPMLVAAAMLPLRAGDATTDDDVLRLREMCVTLVVRDAIARLWPNIVFVVGAGVCVFCSHTLFPFQMQKALAAVGWVYVAMAFGAILAVLIQMRRNVFLRHVASPDPESGAGWDTGFVLRLAVFVLVPLVALFATQFPDIGGVLMRWVDPVRKMLP